MILTGCRELQSFISLLAESREGTLFYHHLISLNDDALAKEVLTIQQENDFPSLTAECKKIPLDLNITSDPSCYSEVGWDKQIKYNIHQLNRSQLLNQMKTYTKLDYAKFVNEDYGVQSYMKNMKIKDGRTFFAHRAQMIRTVQMNFKKMYALGDHRCICGEDDHQIHLTSCPSYAHLRERLDVEERDLDLIRFYQLVIEERMQAEEREDDKERNQRK